MSRSATTAATGRGGDGLRGLLRQRVDPLSPAPLLAASTRSGRSRRCTATSGCLTRTSHRLSDINPVPPGGDPLSGHRPLMFNGDLEVSVCKPTSRFGGFYRNGEGDEVLYVHRGGGTVRTVIWASAFRAPRLRGDPARATHTWELDSAAPPGRLALLPHAGADRVSTALSQPLRPAPRATRRSRDGTSTLRGARDSTTMRARTGDRRRRAASGTSFLTPPVRCRRLGRLRMAVHVQRG